MKIPIGEERIGKMAAALIRVIGCTLRMNIEDRGGLLDRNFRQPLIWTFWHNRIFVVPLLRDRYVRHRMGTVLTSVSKDGAIIAAVMKSFGLKSARGSTSRRGAAALREMAAALAAGEDAGIVPDGPRGPRYKVGPGLVYLARLTGAGILPIHIEYSRALRLKSWDRFMIPLPFTKVRVICDRPIYVPPDADIEAERVRIEQLMQPTTE